MIKAVVQVSARSVTVVDANGSEQAIQITLTPKRWFLTQATKREILATGFLLRYGEELATDQGVINRVLEDIRQQVLRQYEEAENGI